MAIELKDAAKLAEKHLRDLVLVKPDQPVLIEEVSSNGSSWFITLSFSSLYQPASFAFLTGGREYKVLEVSKEDGSLVAMTMHAGKKQG